jgi:hypothetical protein
MPTIVLIIDHIGGPNIGLKTYVEPVRVRSHFRVVTLTMIVVISVSVKTSP